MDDFKEKLDSILREINEENLIYDQSEEWMYREYYEEIQSYAYKKQLLNTALALPVARALHQGSYRGTIVSPSGQKWKRPYFVHSLLVCQMLIVLRIPLAHDEEDILLASALCHDILFVLQFPDQGEEMTDIYKLDHRVTEILKLIYEGNCETEEERQQIFDKVQDNKLALLLRLADRGHVAEELYRVSVWKAHEYIYETKNYYYSMCIYAREKYPELETIIRVLQEKMHDLSVVAEIFVTRYEKRVEELNSEILALQEDNVLLRKKIRDIKTRNNN